MEKKEIELDKLEKVVGGEDEELFGDAEKLNLSPKEKKELKDK